MRPNCNDDFGECRRWYGGVCRRWYWYDANGNPLVPVLVLPVTLGAYASWSDESGLRTNS